MSGHAAVMDGRVGAWKPWWDSRRIEVYNDWKQPRDRFRMPIALALFTIQVGRWPYRGVWFNAALLGFGIRAEWMRYHNSAGEP